MALSTGAVMALLYDVEDPNAHDDWHTWEHVHERLSIPGFVRCSRWERMGDGPRYFILYEIESVAMAESPAYLARLNDPTAWTADSMRQFKAGMARGFCNVTACGGYGLGHIALVVRYVASAGRSSVDGLVRDAQSIASARGSASAYLFEPSGSAPMTREQAIRGGDASLTPMLFVTGHDSAALRRACERYLDPKRLASEGIDVLDASFYGLNFTATAAEIARTPKPRVLAPGERTGRL
jgi:hypothetical protein